MHACFILLLTSAVAAAADVAVLTAKPATLELRRSLATGRKDKGMFTGTIRLVGTPTLEVLGGDGVLLDAVDGAGGSLVNPDYMFGGSKEQRVPLVCGGIGSSTPAEIARQGPVGPQLLLYFAERGADVVIASLHVRATVMLGDASRRIVTIGRWPGVIGEHAELPGSPRIEADQDGQMRMSIDLTAAPAWRTVWLEAVGKPLPSAGGGSEAKAGRLVISRHGRVPDGAEVKAELTAILGERVIDVVVGRWSFPGHGPPPASVSIPVELPHAP